MLTDLITTYTIDHIDLYGGELSVLDEDYLQQLFWILGTFVPHATINVVTNFLKPICIPAYADLTVSFDFNQRERWEIVYANMQKSNTPLHVLILATPELMTQNVDAMVSMLDMPHIKTVEIKPYSENQANAYGANYKEFEEFVKKWITTSVDHTFVLTNELLIEKALTKQTSSWSNDHLYITPTGKYAVLEFDLNDREFFKELNSLAEYSDWVTKEQKAVSANSYCSKCQYIGHCLSEHLRDVKDISRSCNGFKGLLDWYNVER